MTINEQSLLLTCLARQIIRDYPSYTLQNTKPHDYGVTILPSRNEFYDRWLKFHGEESLNSLKVYVEREMQNFRVWCALEEIPASHSAFPRYMESNPARVLSDRMPVEPAPLSEVRPWWAGLPHLAPGYVSPLVRDLMGKGGASC